MALDRTNYNALVDDDGTGNVGTVWNKNQVKTVILDPVDALMIPSSGNGIWTPVIGGAGGTSGQTYTTQAGFHKRIDNLVFVTFFVVLSAKGTITGSVQIQGLPFQGSVNANQFQAGSVQWSGLNTTWVNITLQMLNGATAINVVGSVAANSNNGVALVTADIANTSQFIGSMVYMV